MIAKDSCVPHGGRQRHQLHRVQLHAAAGLRLLPPAPTHNCELQIGGSDQWGNITAGTDLIRKKLGVTAWGWTFPLITKADGTKFGKTEGGAVWLDPKKTSPYKFYQFFVNTEDAKVGEYLRKFTFLTRPQIEELEAKHAANPGAREAHKALATEVTRSSTARRAYEAALKASAILFGAEIGDTSEETFQDVVGEIPTRDLEKAKLEGAGTALTDLLVQAGLAPSKGQARKDIEGGGIYVNNVKSPDIARSLTTSDLLYGKFESADETERGAWLKVCEDKLGQAWGDSDDVFNELLAK
jgi:tyrosyl-tRNA synthetase